MMRKNVYSDILPHFAHCLTGNLALSASTSSFPPTLHWSVLQGCKVTHLLCSRRSTWHSLERKRKMFYEATRGGVCRLRTRIACCTSPEEGSVEQSLSYQARRALLQQTVPQYREASPSQKWTFVDAFVAATGYHRTYARWLLNHADEVQQTLQRPRPRQYGPEVQHALFLAWHAANRICTKRLIPFLPTLLETLERHEHLYILEECRKQLLSMSAATADRLLSSQRKQSQRGLSTT